MAQAPAAPAARAPAAAPVVSVPAASAAYVSVAPAARSPVAPVARASAAPVDLPTKPAHVSAAQVPGVRSLPTQAPGIQPSTTSAAPNAAVSAIPVSTPSVPGTPPATVVASDNASAKQMMHGLDKVYGSLQQLRQRLSQRMTSGQTNGRGQSNDQDMRELCVALEQTRNFLVGVLAESTAAPGLVVPLKHIKKLTETHGESIKKKWTAEKQMKASVEVNQTIVKLMQAIKQWVAQSHSAASQSSTPLAVSPVAAAGLPPISLQPAALAATKAPLALTPAVPAP
ncbi:hypothetical protein H4R20_007186, partial [Coemansia guatemalensis]